MEFHVEKQNFVQFHNFLPLCHTGFSLQTLKYNMSLPWKAQQTGKYHPIAPERLHIMILSTDSLKVRTISCSTINNSTGKNCSVAFIWNPTLGFYQQTKKSRTVFYSIINNTYGKYCSIVFTRMGGTLQDFVYRLGTIRIYASVVFTWMVEQGFHPQTQKLEPSCAVNKQNGWKELLTNFHLNCHT